jgi:hypothetical protein
MARFVDGDAPQSGFSSGQGLRQQVTAAAAEASRIERECPEGQGRQEGNPGRRNPQQRAADGEQTHQSHSQTSP